MPRGDGTGPAGLGQMTGRSAGYCAGFDIPGFANRIPGDVGRVPNPVGAFPRPGLGQGRGGRGGGRGRGAGRGRGGRRS